ncbi:MAG: resuscitation-promoting factor RpfE [Solirubrobacteraceae bacterium]|jgi:hypothetical protein|nr:resuscitation-promoting factor RpfE [Solirubrobacteraceae bacterium]
MRLRTLGAVCATSAVALPLTTLVPIAAAQAPAAAAPAPPGAAAPPSALPVLPGDLHIAAMQQLTTKHLYFARRYHRLLGDPLSLPERRALRAEVARLTPPTLRDETRHLRADIRQLRGRLQRHTGGGAADVSLPPQLSAIAACESGGNPRALSAGGTYRGKYQFDFSTWRSVGGNGDPAAAPESEQDRRAAKLYRSAGAGRWPVCGR